MSQQALERLLEGNRRFARNRPALDASVERRLAVSQGQQPFAMVFGCVDSRVPPEVIFDQGLGDLLVARTAGLVVDRAVLGSLEFGAAALKIPLLVVLGHDGCGAVKAAVDALTGAADAPAPGSGMAYLVEALRPAVAAAKAAGAETAAEAAAAAETAAGAGGDLWEMAGRAKVLLQVERLKREPALAPAVERGALAVVGARYNLASGLVEIIAEG